jgi:hypothetical protein
MCFCHNLCAFCLQPFSAAYFCLFNILAGESIQKFVVFYWIMATSPSGYPPQLSLVQCLTEPTIPEMVKNAAGKDETFWMRETTWFPKKNNQLTIQKNRPQEILGFPTIINMVLPIFFPL